MVNVLCPVLHRSFHPGSDFLVFGTFLAITTTKVMMETN
jgi:hypothetical protein